MWMTMSDIGSHYIGYEDSDHRSHYFAVERVEDPPRELIEGMEPGAGSCIREIDDEHLVERTSSGDIRVWRRMYPKQGKGV